MPLPLRLSEVDITLKQLITTLTLDPVFREPISTSRYEDAIVLRGQPNFGYPRGTFKQLERTLTGDEQKSSGHIVWKKSYLDTKGITLKKGDLITKMDDVDMELEITEVRYESPLRGRFLLVYTTVEKRHEKRDSK